MASHMSRHVKGNRRNGTQRLAVETVTQAMPDERESREDGGAGVGTKESEKESRRALWSASSA